jgi:hypothetical protein
MNRVFNHYEPLAGLYACYSRNFLLQVFTNIPVMTIRFGDHRASIRHALSVLFNEVLLMRHYPIRFKCVCCTPQGLPRFSYGSYLDR